MPERQARKSPVFPMLIAAVAALIALGFTVIPQLSTDRDTADARGSEPQGQSAAAASAAPSGTPAPAAATMARRQQNDPMAMGEKDAPVVLIEYSDFQCPFCGQFARETAPKLIEKYVRTGTLRIEWRDFPYLGNESKLAAHAARAAAAQDKFWEFHDAMYADQPRPNSGALTVRRLTEIADGIGLNETRFGADLDSDATEDAVERDFQEGIAIGVTGTPAFLINGQPIMGAQPTEVFEQAIEAAAKES